MSQNVYGSDRCGSIKPFAWRDFVQFVVVREKEANQRCCVCVCVFRVHYRFGLGGGKVKIIRLYS